MIRALACYLLMASVYLLYWPHAEFVSDDWFQLGFYLSHSEMSVVRTLMRNQLYGVFELSWLSRVVDSLIAAVFGYAPRLLFTLALAVHLTNAWLFYRLLVRLRVAERLALWAGAGYLVIPTAHNAVLWFVNNDFYHRPPLFLFVFLLSFVGTVEWGRLTWRTGAWQAFLLLTVLFLGGAPSFFLVLFSGPWMVLCFFPRDRWKPALRVTAFHAAVIVLCLVVYVRVISAVPSGIGGRYDFSFLFLRRNLGLMASHLAGLSGLGSAAYHLRPEVTQVVASLLAVLAVGLAGRGLAEARPAWRAPVFAVGMITLAYAPLLFLVGATLRHYYTVSPYLALLLMSLCDRLPVRRVAAGLLVAWFAAATVADIRQCWIPQSQHLQALKAGLRRLRNLEPGDLVVVPGTPWVIGTAQNFALIIDLWARNFAWHVTGVRDLQFWREIVIEQGRLRLYQRATMRDTGAAELTRAHVLLGPPQGPYQPARYWAEPVGPNRSLPHCLKDNPCETPPADAPAEQTYIPKPFDPHHPQHRLY